MIDVDGSVMASEVESSNKSSRDASDRPNEPDNIVCPITHVMFRDPVFVPESGNTYEREAIVRYWASQHQPRDPLTNTLLPGAQVHTNWGIRREVQRFLDAHPDYIPQGWTDRNVPPPATSGQKPAGAMVAKPAVIALALLLVAVFGGLAGHAAWRSAEWLRASDNRSGDGVYGDGSGDPLLDKSSSAADAARAERLRPPRDSQINAWRISNATLDIRIPPSGVSNEALGQALFTAVWLAVTFTWTAGMVNGNAPWFVIAFSLLFWGSGASMMLNIGRMVFASEVISLDAENYSITTVALGYEMEQVHGLLADLVGPPEVDCEEPSACCVLLEDGQLDVVYALPELPRLRRAEAKWLQTIVSEHWEQHFGNSSVAERWRSAKAAARHDRDRIPDDDRSEESGSHRDRIEERRYRSRRRQKEQGQFHPVGGGLPLAGGFGGVGGFAFGPGFAVVMR